jgi:hypothetical protein
MCSMSINIADIDEGGSVKLRNGDVKKVESVSNKGAFFYIRFEGKCYTDIYHYNGVFYSPVDNHPLDIVEIIPFTSVKSRPQRYECEGGGLILDMLNIHHCKNLQKVYDEDGISGNGYSFEGVT